MGWDVVRKSAAKTPRYVHDRDDHSQIRDEHRKPMHAGDKSQRHETQTSHDTAFVPRAAGVQTTKGPIRARSGQRPVKEGKLCVLSWLGAWRYGVGRKYFDLSGR